MQLIPLLSLPNQSITLSLGGVNWEINIKLANTVMVIDVIRDDIVLVQGARLLADMPVLPYQYQEAFGNFILLSENEELADWNRFELDQTFIYLSPAELASVADA
jgi:hypothetical protein